MLKNYEKISIEFPKIICRKKSRKFHNGNLIGTFLRKLVLITNLQFNEGLSKNKSYY